jgi:hypothetical protein
MKRPGKLFAALICGLISLTLLYGCNGDSDNEEATTPTPQARTTASDVIDRVLDIVFGDDVGVTNQTRGQRSQGNAITRQTNVTVTVSCATGQASFNGEVTEDAESFTIDGAITFTNCEGINGVLTLDVTGTIGSNAITVIVTLNGSVTAEGCTVTFNAFSASATANLSGIITSPIIANGSVSATCDSGSATCTLNNVDLSNQTAFENSCQG